MRVHSTYTSELFYGKSAKKTDELKLIFFLNDHFLLNFTNFYVFTVQNNVFEQTNVYVCFI